jgi:hypothetical protein
MFKIPQSSSTPSALAPTIPSAHHSGHLTKKFWPLLKGIFWDRLRSSDPQEFLIWVLRTTAFSSKRGFRWKAMSLPEHRLMWNLEWVALRDPVWPMRLGSSPSPPAWSQGVARMTLGVSLLLEALSYLLALGSTVPDTMMDLDGYSPPQMVVK